MSGPCVERLSMDSSFLISLQNKLLQLMHSQPLDEELEDSVITLNNAICSTLARRGTG